MAYLSSAAAAPSTGGGSFIHPSLVIYIYIYQVLSLVAMEPPVKVSGAGHSDYVRDAKVQALDCISPVTLDDVVLGQYVGDDENQGYLDGKS